MAVHRPENRDHRRRVRDFGLWLLLAAGIVVGANGVAAAQTIVAAVLPGSRSVQVGSPATAFATILNLGPARATGCRLGLATGVPATFSFQSTSPATNVPTGTPDTPVDIPPGAGQTFVFSLTPSAPIPPTEVEIAFACANGAPASVIPGVNTLLLSASASPVPDIVALGATPTGDGIAYAEYMSGSGATASTAFAVATVNVGAAATITATADTGGVSLPVSVAICQTDPQTSTCLAPPAASAATGIAAGATPTFALFITFTNEVALNPAINRLFVRFRDSGGTTRGSTSVALATGGGAGGGASSLTAADVRAVVQGAAQAVDVPLVIAVVDRMGNPLALFSKPGASATATGNFSSPVDANELAVSLARTGAFFSNSQAPLSSRTVRFISGIHFPPGITNKANAALYGIENTNRGCSLNTLFNPGKTITPARSLNGLPCSALDRRGCGLGISTGKADTADSNPNAVNPGGIPIFKGGLLVGGIGVVAPRLDIAEFAALVGSVSSAGLGPVVPDPGVILLDGIVLPFVVQKTQPDGTSPGALAGSFSSGPIASPLGDAGVPDGWLVGPFTGTFLTADEVTRIVQQANDQANLSRAAIRLPLGSTTRMMIAVADLDGTILGLFRMPDATIFSIDVAAAKARNVIYFSGGTRTVADLPGVPFNTQVTNRTISFGAQPLYPPGIDGSGPGPFFPLFLNDVATPCSQGAQAANLNQSGIVFFPGSTPLWKNGQMAGGLGVSGDGVEQDDLVSAAGATGFAPPVQLRADQVLVGGIRLPYFKFPRNPEGL